MFKKQKQNNETQEMIKHLLVLGYQPKDVTIFYKKYTNKIYTMLHKRFG